MWFVTRLFQGFSKTKSLSLATCKPARICLPILLSLSAAASRFTLSLIFRSRLGGWLRSSLYFFLAPQMQRQA